MELVRYHGDFGCGEALWYRCGHGHGHRSEPGVEHRHEHRYSPADQQLSSAGHIAERSTETTFESSADNKRTLATFLGANGHAIDTYQFFIGQLARQFDVLALDHPALWPQAEQPGARDSFNSFADDFGQFLDHSNADCPPPIHIGHSLGGSVGVLEALRRPQRFQRLVIIEPGTTPNFITHLFFSLLPRRLRRQLGFIKKTAARRTSWPSPEEFMRDMRSKRLYHRFCDEAMQDYARGGLQAEQGRYQLRFPPQWESHIFTSVRYIWPLILRLKVPTLVLRAEHSNYISRCIFNSYRWLAQYLNPQIRFQEIADAGHLLIQDRPDAVLAAISQWLDDVPISPTVQVR